MIGYDIFRFLADEIDNTYSWIEVASGHTDTFFVDDRVPNDMTESYQYAIFARYSNDNVSIAVYSDIVDYQKKVSEVDTPKPLVTGLIGNYPNPFNPETVISFQVGNWIALSQAHRKDNESNLITFSQASPNNKVTIEIFNIKGQKIRTLVDDLFAPGTYSVVWDGRDDFDREVGSGIYFYRMQTEELTQTRKMVLIK
jgi:hypothetical protein